MAPLNWMSLLNMFIIIFIMYMCMNYYTYMNQSSQFFLTNSNPYKYWKW
uniref:ATP synthase F0 subunit 8 n=1 Tax=Lucifotychus sp. 1 EF-2015 TaxID=1756870 RepID=A0A0S2M7L1_9COLE|nr:ATP synthase F0 subunit 8 [Lucifotychus sp. 1 EF-2015]